MFNGQTNLALRQSQAKTCVDPQRSAPRPAPDLTRWHRLIAELRNPDLELDTETFAGLWREYARLKARGHAFDPMLAALLLILQRQLLLTDDGVGEFASSAIGGA